MIWIYIVFKKRNVCLIWVENSVDPDQIGSLDSSSVSKKRIDTGTEEKGLNRILRLIRVENSVKPSMITTDIIEGISRRNSMCPF